jgi:hypothetical protein
VRIVRGEPAHREGGRVAPAEQDRSGGAQRRDDRIVLCGPHACQRGQAVAGQATPLRGVDLGGDGDAVQRAEHLPGGDGFIGPARVGERLLGSHVEQCVQPGVHGLDPVQTRLDGLDRRDPTFPDSRRELDRRQLPQLHVTPRYHRHGRPVRVR